MVDREARHAQRVCLDDPLTVSMKSIGSDVKYDLITKEVSNNGFFLAFDKPGRFPFSKSSILEVSLDFGDSQKISFNGQMARIIFPKDEAAKVFGPGIAIKIVQIAEDQQQKLDDFIKKKAQEEELEEQRRTSKKAS